MTPKIEFEKLKRRKKLYRKMIKKLRKCTNTGYCYAIAKIRGYENREQFPKAMQELEELQELIIFKPKRKYKEAYWFSPRRILLRIILLRFAIIIANYKIWKYEHNR